ncbi:TerC-like integral membrane protein [Lentilactobacillus kosonis]|uniref:TerC-like integral membrane protein n=1 Tax=Lentilactobacillus kosonis TaxID=2810561 RepID=A0A401FIA7_9LACO|nr:TerC-like integral membrane protein [Lentilactobacillus kosonis]
MGILEELYGPFFDLHNWEMVITSSSDWLIIFSLVIIECLLSVDNAVVLAAQTQVLPTKKPAGKIIILRFVGRLCI